MKMIIMRLMMMMMMMMMIVMRRTLHLFFFSKKYFSRRDFRLKFIAGMLVKKKPGGCMTEYNHVGRPFLLQVHGRLYRLKTAVKKAGERPTFVM